MPRPHPVVNVASVPPDGFRGSIDKTDIQVFFIDIFAVFPAFEEFDDTAVNILTIFFRTFFYFPAFSFHQTFTLGHITCRTRRAYDIAADIFDPGKYIGVEVGGGYLLCGTCCQKTVF